MKQLVVIFAGILISLHLSAQQAPALQRSLPPAGRIYGKVVDSLGKGIGDASVLLLENRFDSASKKTKEVLLKGISSQANGDFNFEDVKAAGDLTLNISAMGYQSYNQSVSLKPAAPSQPANGQTPNFNSMGGNLEKDLGKISLSTDVQQLGAVVVTANSGRLRMDIDKKVFNVDQNIVSAGGTAVDVMKNVPSVNVDIDGNVTMRNATPQIYIDGRPTTLSLDQIPADAIESVEVITNPSAKYDASGGTAGILNIILKKNKKSGYNGNINAGIDKRGGVNAGGGFNLRQDKFNISLNAFSNQMRNRNTGSTDITNLLTSPNLLVSQDNSTRMKGGFLFGRVGIDYFATNRTTFSVGAVKVHGKFNPVSFLQADSAYQDGTFVSYSERNTDNTREFNAHGIQGGFKHLFPTKGEELTADVNYFSGRGTNEANYNTSLYSGHGSTKTGESLQRILGAGTNQFLTLQTDYVKPLGKSAKIETGVRAQMRKLTNGQANYFYDYTAGEYVAIPSASSNYRNTDNVYAAYISLENSIKSFGYKLGLRAESSEYEGELTDTKQTFNNKYPISLFPSVFLSQKLPNKQEVQLSYTRRINRPFFMQVIPFIDSTDQLNWTQGNAALKPEFTSSVEASYTKSFPGNHTLMGSVYYKHTTDLITRYLDTIATGAGAKRPVLTYINANSSRSVGFEVTSQNTFTKWWDMNTNVNVYNSKINTDNIDGNSQGAMWSWFGKVNSNFKLPSNFKIQLSGTYQSKTNLPVNQGGNSGPGNGPPMGTSQSAAQGYIKSNYGVDVAVQKNFLKNNAASVTFSVNDVFRTRRFEQYSESAYFIQNNYRLNDVPMMRLTFSFKFGQMDMSLFKRKNTKGESEGAQGAMQGL